MRENIKGKRLTYFSSIFFNFFFISSDFRYHFIVTTWYCSIDWAALPPHPRNLDWPKLMVERRLPKQYKFSEYDCFRTRLSIHPSCYSVWFSKMQLMRSKKLCNGRPGRAYWDLPKFSGGPSGGWSTHGAGKCFKARQDIAGQVYRQQ